MKKFHTTKGFTLVELIIVVSIIAVLASLAFMALSGETAQARDSKRVADIKTFEDAIATSNGKNKKIDYVAKGATHYSILSTEDDATFATTKITTNNGDIFPLRGAYLVKIQDGIFDSDVLPTSPRDPKGSNYLGAFLSSTDYQLFATKENPSTKIETSVVKGSFKEGAILDILMQDINESDATFKVATPQRFIAGDMIQIDNEKMEVVSFNPTAKTLTVKNTEPSPSVYVRTPQSGTDAKVHNKGAAIKLITAASNATNKYSSNGLLCLGQLKVAGGTTVLDGDTASKKWSDAMKVDESKGVVCDTSVDKKGTIQDDTTILPYTISN